MEEKKEPQVKSSAVMEPFIYFYPSALSLRKLQLQTFLKIAWCNEPGVIANHDTESLHDHRVCLRKVRSVLSLFETTPDQSIHELRIRCKKLRYLMEFFAPLFPLSDSPEIRAAYHELFHAADATDENNRLLQ